MYGYIYKTTNLINNKIYIGQHRFYLNKNKKDSDYYGSGVHLKKAIEKYGKENFKNEIIEECFNSDDLNDKEKYWIAKLDATNPDIGYNISPGGQDFEFIEKAVDCFDIFGNKIATYKSISDASRSTGASHIPHCLSNERKLSGGYQWKYHDDRNDFIDIIYKTSPNAQPIEQLTLDGESIWIYPSVSAAVKMLFGKTFNRNYERHIRRACSDNKKQAYGYKWKFYERSETAALADKLND